MVASNFIIIVANPTFITPNVTELTVIAMRNATLNCEGEGEPEVIYEWFYVNDSGELLRLFYQ